MLDSFLLHCRAKNLAETTRASYERALLNVEVNVGKPLETLTRQDIERFLADSFESDLSEATVAKHYRTLQQFYKWLCDIEEEVEVNPIAKVPLPTVTVNPPDVITEDEIEQLLATCKPLNRFESRRDTAIIRVLYDTGMRVGELVGLTVDDIDLQHQVIIIQRGKGGRRRVVAMLPETSQAIDRYRRARDTHKDRSASEFWLGERGPLLYAGIRQILRRRCKDAGIRHLNPHLFRHTFTHRLKSANVSDENIMTAAGWTTTQMLHRYGAGAAEQRSQEAIRQALS